MRDEMDIHRQVAWNAACRLVEFDRRSLAGAAGIGYETAGVWVRRWLRAGTIEPLGKRGGTTEWYRIAGAPALPVAEPKGQTPQGNQWRAIRKFGGPFTPVDIAAHSSTAAAPVSRADAQAYCQMLVKGGYLRVRRRAVPGKREAVYQLIRDTGPKPPRERRVRAIWDDNDGAFVHLPDGGAP